MALPAAGLALAQAAGAAPAASEEEELRLLNFPAAREDLATAVPLTLIFGLLLVTGCAGNLCTAIVIARPKNKYMHTATNCYLFSLALSDFMFLILGLPQEMHSLWQRYPYGFGEWFCVGRGWLSEASTYASILTISAFTVERYVAICHPLWAHTMSRLPRAITSVVLIWLLAALSAIPPAAELGIVTQRGPLSQRPLPASAQCATKRVIYENMFVASAVVFFILPMLIVSVLYILIALELRRSSRIQAKLAGGHQHLLAAAPTGPGCPCQLRGPARAASARPGAPAKQAGQPLSLHQSLWGRPGAAGHVLVRGRPHSAAKKSVVRMLVAVVVSFFICWVPFHAQRLLASYLAKGENQNQLLLDLYLKLTYISGVMYYLSSTINPLLYQLMSAKFRLAFKETFKCSLFSCARLGMPKSAPNNARSPNHSLKGAPTPQLMAGCDLGPGHGSCACACACCARARRQHLLELPGQGLLARLSSSLISLGQKTAPQPTPGICSCRQGHTVTLSQSASCASTPLLRQAAPTRLKIGDTGTDLEAGKARLQPLIRPASALASLAAQPAPQLTGRLSRQEVATALNSEHEDDTSSEIGKLDHSDEEPDEVEDEDEDEQCTSGAHLVGGLSSSPSSAVSSTGQLRSTETAACNGQNTRLGLAECRGRHQGTGAIYSVTSRDRNTRTAGLGGPRSVPRHLSTTSGSSAGSFSTGRAWPGRTRRRSSSLSSWLDKKLSVSSGADCVSLSTTNSQVTPAGHSSSYGLNYLEGPGLDPFSSSPPSAVVVVVVAATDRSTPLVGLANC